MKKTAIFLIFLLTGCGSFTQTRSSLPAGTSYLGLWAAGETVSLLSTNKMMEDHLVSLITQKDCSLPRVLQNEGKYCMTQEELFKASLPDFKIEKVYCYQSIAAPTCYDRPSPYPDDRLIGIYDKPVYPPNEYF